MLRHFSALLFLVSFAVAVGKLLAQGGGNVIPIGESRPGTIKIGETRPGTIQMETDEDLQAKHRAAFPEELWKPMPVPVEEDRVAGPTGGVGRQAGQSSSEAGFVLVATVDVSSVSAQIAASDDGKLVVGIRTGRQAQAGVEVLNGRMRRWSCGNGLEVEGRLSWFDNKKCVITTAYDTEETIMKSALSEEDANAIKLVTDACLGELKRMRGAK